MYQQSITDENAGIEGTSACKKIIISRQPNVRSSATICQTALESNLSK